MDIIDLASRFQFDPLLPLDAELIQGQVTGLGRPQECRCNNPIPGLRIQKMAANITAWQEGPRGRGGSPGRLPAGRFVGLSGRARRGEPGFLLKLACFTSSFAIIPGADLMKEGKP